MPTFQPIPVLLISFGVILIVIGLLWQFGSKIIPFGKLPGDIVVDKPNFNLYFPITTSIIISIVLTLILWVIMYFRK